MAKSTYLDMVNEVLIRLKESKIDDVSSVSGKSEMTTNFINRAHSNLYNETTNWYTLHTTRKFAIVRYNVSTISFTSANPPTIGDSASGFGSFSDGMTILVAGDSDNNGIYVIDKAFNGGVYNAAREQSHDLIITANATNPTYQVDVDADYIILWDSNGKPHRINDLDVTVDLTASGANGLDTGSEAASTDYYIWIISTGDTDAGLFSTSDTSPTLPSGYTYKRLIGKTFNDNGSDLVSVTHGATAGTLTLQPWDTLTTEAAGDDVTITAMTYPLAADWASTISLIDYTNDTVLIAENTAGFDLNDPGLDSTSDSSYAGIEGEFYRLHYPPDSAATLIERYWRIPKTLRENHDVSDLPLFCENFIIEWTYAQMCKPLNKIELAREAMAEAERYKDNAISANQNMLKRLNYYRYGNENENKTRYY